MYRKVANRSLFRLVAHTTIFRLLMKGKCYVYLVWPLGGNFSFAIVAWSTVHDSKGSLKFHNFKIFLRSYLQNRSKSPLLYFFGVSQAIPKFFHKIYGVKWMSRWRGVAHSISSMYFWQKFGLNWQMSQA